MDFSVVDLRNVKGTRLLHKGRNSTYRVLRVVKIKIDNCWIAGLEYRCESSGEVYVRPTTAFGNFTKAPRRTFLGFLKSLVWW